jgi:hypothetical protein
MQWGRTALLLRTFGDELSTVALRPVAMFSSCSHTLKRDTGDEDDSSRIMIPWVRTVINGVAIMRHPKYNKVIRLSSATMLHARRPCLMVDAEIASSEHF